MKFNKDGKQKRTTQYLRDCKPLHKVCIQFLRDNISVPEVTCVRFKKESFKQDSSARIIDIGLFVLCLALHNKLLVYLAVYRPNTTLQGII
jgi:hypothetical protein